MDLSRLSKDETIKDKEKLLKENLEMTRKFLSEKLDLSFALGGNPLIQMEQMLSTIPGAEMVKQLSESYTNVIKSSEYENLSKALKDLNNSAGIYIAKINEPFKQLSEQLAEVQKVIGLPNEIIKDSSYIPNNFSISTIVKDNFNNVEIYVKNKNDTSVLQYDLSNISSDKGVIDFLHDIPNENVMKFLTYLQNYPYLALLDDTGKKIFEAIKQEVPKYTVKENNKTFYHARAKEKNAGAWSPNEMGPVEYGISGFGRFNFIGKPAYYLATEIETAKKEVQTDLYLESTVMRLTQIKNMNVFDISSEQCPLVSFCNMKKNKGANDCSAYLVPNFLSVCCLYMNNLKPHTVDAIKYKSTKNSNGICYVTLDKNPLEFFDDGEIIF